MEFMKELLAMQKPVNESEAAKLLFINLNTNKVTGDKSLLDQFTFDNVDEIDSDDLYEDDEGNAEGTITVFLTTSVGWDSIEITGESFSPMLLKFNTLSDEEKKETINDLREKVQRELK